jgi:hypothetical protein
MSAPAPARVARSSTDMAVRMRNRLLTRLLMTSTALVVFAWPADGALITFNTRGAFNAAAPGLPVEAFDGHVCGRRLDLPWTADDGARMSKDARNSGPAFRPGRPPTGYHLQLYQRHPGARGRCSDLRLRFSRCADRDASAAEGLRRSHRVARLRPHTLPRNTQEGRWL